MQKNVGGIDRVLRLIVGIVLIALVFVGLVLCLSAVTGLRWVTQDLGDDLVETARVCIVRRNRQQR